MSVTIEGNDQVLVDISHELSAVENQVKQLTSELKWSKRRQEQMSKELLGTMARLNRLEQWQLLQQGSKAEA